MSINRFQAKRPGSVPTYVCRICKHNTRNVGGDEMGVRLCLSCFDLASIENAQLDYGIEGAMKYRNEVVSSINAIESRGNGDAGWRKVFAYMDLPVTCQRNAR